MTRKPIASALIICGAVAAFAPSHAMSRADVDGDGVMSLQEFLDGYPDLSATEFTAADSNADGVIDADEFASAVDAGVLPVEEG